MSSEPENFESLRKLLALKKHEQPPPGYFENFAGEVRTRLAGGERRQSDWWQDLGEEASWLQRLWASFVERPSFAAAFGVAVCAVVFGGIYFTQKPEAESGASTLAQSWKIQSPADAAAVVGQVAPVTELASSSTNPVMATPGKSLFDQMNMPVQTAPVSFNGN